MAKLCDADDVTLLKAFIELRDRRAQRKAAFTEDDEGDKLKQEKIENEFLRRFQERGIDNVSARGIGTAYSATRSSASVADWDAFFSHVLKNDAFELLEHRANKSAVEQFKTVHNDVPPGINWSETRVVNFRRK